MLTQCVNMFATLFTLYLIVCIACSGRARCVAEGAYEEVVADEVKAESKELTALLIEILYIYILYNYINNMLNGEIEQSFPIAHERNMLKHTQVVDLWGICSIVCKYSLC